jgi:hypothetical protein
MRDQARTECRIGGVVDRTSIGDGALEEAIEPHMVLGEQAGQGTKHQELLRLGHSAVCTPAHGPFAASQHGPCAGSLEDASVCPAGSSATPIQTRGLVRILQRVVVRPHHHRRGRLGQRDLQRRAIFQI